MRKVSRRVPTWKEIAEFLERCGWFTKEIKADKVVFEMGDRELIAFRTMTGKWKVEYLVNKKLRDSAGITDEKHARILATEMGFLR